jgi:hypothetical protein
MKRRGDLPREGIATEAAQSLSFRNYVGHRHRRVAIAAAVVPDDFHPREEIANSSRAVGRKEGEQMTVRCNQVAIHPAHRRASLIARVILTVATLTAATRPKS